MTMLVFSESILAFAGIAAEGKIFLISARCPDPGGTNPAPNNPPPVDDEECISCTCFDLFSFLNNLSCAAAASHRIRNSIRFNHVTAAAGKNCPQLRAKLAPFSGVRIKR